MQAQHMQAPPMQAQHMQAAAPSRYAAMTATVLPTEARAATLPATLQPLQPLASRQPSASAPPQPQPTVVIATASASAPAPAIPAVTGGLASLNMAPMHSRAAVALPSAAPPSTSAADGYSGGVACSATGGRSGGGGYTGGAVGGIDFSMPSVPSRPMAATSAASAAIPPASAGSAAGTFAGVPAVRPPGSTPPTGSSCRCCPPPFSWTGASAATGEVAGGGAAAGHAVQPSVGLRPLVIPQDLIPTFLRLSAANTARKIETCAILVGVMRNGELVVDRLLVPSQEGTPDTCTTTDEDEIWEYCEGRELMTFGWIHTHPTQTCFLSSVDLHTHCGK